MAKSSLTNTSYFWHEILLPYGTKVKTISKPEMEALIWGFKQIRGAEIDLDSLKDLAYKQAFVLHDKTGIPFKYIWEGRIYNVLRKIPTKSIL